jgi:uncharacterized protein (TIGR00369 family)
VTQPQPNDFSATAARIEGSFAKQGAMGLIGARLVKVAAGEVHIELPFHLGLSQQHGFLHAGILTTALDSACGYAAASVMPENSGVLTIEFKVNLMAPGKGERFIFIGRVAKPGRTIVFAEGEAFAVIADKPENKRIATMSATCMVVMDRPDVKG